MESLEGRNLFKDKMKLIPLTRGKFSKVDDEDYDLLMHWHWTCSVAGYAVRGIKKNKKCIAILMHRQLINAPKGISTDHINGDCLDNQKSNLRLCTHAENIRNSKRHRNNTTGFKGVSFVDGKWRMHIKKNYKMFWFGYFGTPEEAARAYDEKAKELFGEYARTNF